MERIFTKQFWAETMYVFMWLVIYFAPLLAGIVIVHKFYMHDASIWPANAKVVAIIYLLTTVVLWNECVANPRATKHLREWRIKRTAQD